MNPTRTLAWLAVTVVAAAGCAGQTPLTAASSAPAGTPPAGTPGSRPTVTSTARPTQSAFTPRPLPTYPAGRAGTPAGGIPPATTLTSPDPDVVARAALTATWTSDTALDTSPADAARRALPWLGGALARTVAAAARPIAPGATWNTWAAHHAHTVVVVAPVSDEHPPDTASTADREYLLTVTPVGPGWHGTPAIAVVNLQLTRTGHSWRVTQLGQQTG